MRRLFAFLLIVCFAYFVQCDENLVLTEGALEAAQYVGEKMINEVISSIRGFKATRKFHQGGIDGDVTLHDVDVRLVQIPDVSGQLKTPSKIRLELDNMHAAMDGKFVGNAGWFSTTGTVHGDIKQVKIVLKTDIQRLPNGQLEVKMEKCRTVVGESKFTINGQGVLGTVAKNFEGPLNKELTVKLPHMMCQGLKLAVEKLGPEHFGRLLKAPIDQAFKKTEKTELFLKNLKQ